MKVSVIRSSSDEEDEIIFRCHTLSDDMDRLIHKLRYGEKSLPDMMSMESVPLQHQISIILRQSITKYSHIASKAFMRLRKDYIS